MPENFHNPIGKSLEDQSYVVGHLKDLESLVWNNEDAPPETESAIRGSNPQALSHNTQTNNWGRIDIGIDEDSEFVSYS